MLKKKEKKLFLKDIIKTDFHKKIFSSAKDVFSNATNIPEYIASNSTKITLIDNKKILIESYKCIDEYYTHYIKINTSNLSVIIDGKDLNIKEITDEDLIITGSIVSVNFKE